MDDKFLSSLRVNENRVEAWLIEASGWPWFLYSCSDYVRFFVLLGTAFRYA